ncbi:hypothetical protein [Methylobacterium sp. SI9]|uniref:hypothetical protein n=1 Tax=Methylobacterium guangdongense TaxID=3138811 RepID=UPI00313E68A9
MMADLRAALKEGISAAAGEPIDRLLSAGTLTPAGVALLDPDNPQLIAVVWVGTWGWAYFALGVLAWLAGVRTGIRWGE